eukprot:TRINITY_DN9665_c0_g1_i1.p1 TRINITY_DN9665_c0_g1~~TRINITY_DN9665_c0_g1_i1.p1  ORF type:complete len:484 (+),score=158.08 TRINITY_DN9665_c0_g1_i1:63-1454(+)
MSEKEEAPPKVAATEEEEEAKRAEKAAKNKAKKERQKAKAKEAKEATGKSQEEKNKELMDVMMPAKFRDPAGKTHKFWDKQPVMQLSKPFEIGDAEEACEKKSTDEVRKEPLDLPDGLEWWCPDVTKDDEMNLIYELLRDHYVEDDDAMFRFNYTHEFLRWALLPPNHFKDWHVAIRSKTDSSLVGFISGIPVNIDARGNTIRMCEINFLCVNKQTRAKGLAPLLISEVTRRVNLKGIWQAIYTAGIVITSTIAQCQYWHRSLNPQKLIQIGFSRVPQAFEKFAKPMDQVKKFYSLPEKPKIPKIRKMEKKDCKQVRALLEQYLSKFGVHQAWSNDEVQHWLLPRDGVVDSFVVVSDEGKVTDFCSFYSLPSTVIGATKHKTLNAAYCYYNIANTVPLKDLLYDAMVLAKQKDLDVFNALDIMDNAEIFSPLKFGMGDGHLRYYFYNWKFPQLKPSNVGIVLL